MHTLEPSRVVGTIPSTSGEDFGKFSGGVGEVSRKGAKAQRGDAKIGGRDLPRRAQRGKEKRICSRRIADWGSAIPFVRVPLSTVGAMHEATPVVPDYLLIKTRPVGVSILSALMLLSGVAMAGLLFFAAFFMDWKGRESQLATAAATIGAPVSMLIGSVVFLAALAIEAGFGMWQGRRWGWWLGSFWFVYAIFRNANALLKLKMMTAGMSPLELALELPLRFAAGQ